MEKIRPDKSVGLYDIHSKILRQPVLCSTIPKVFKRNFLKAARGKITARKTRTIGNQKMYIYKKKIVKQKERKFDFTAQTILNPLGTTNRLYY